MRLIGILCDRINCQDKTLTLSDLLYSYKNDFAKWEPNKRLNSLNTTSIDLWIEKSSIVESMKWFDELLDYESLIEKELV